MKKEKLSLQGIKNVLSRAEMKKIMAGSGPGAGSCCYCYECAGGGTYYVVDTAGKGCPLTCYISHGCSFGFYSSGGCA